MSDKGSAHLRHVELARKILQVAIGRDMKAGDRLVEQALAVQCNVSRTPIRKALMVLADQGVVAADPEGGLCLAVDAALIPGLEPTGEGTAEDGLHAAILRDLGAGRIDETQTVASLQRRYGAARQSVQNALVKLGEDGMAERGAGQQWVLKQFAVSVDAVAASYEFRLATEPLALTLPGFRRDATAILSLRQSMLALRRMEEDSFNRRLFERTDFDFHMLVAAGCGNPFLAEALAGHHRRRRAAPSGPVSTWRMMQSNMEHLQIVEQIERGQMQLAADLMRVHLQLSQSQRPRLAGRGVPPAFKIVAGRAETA
jgi:DNA-binding GntR family transcriptional regulator